MDPATAGGAVNQSPRRVQRVGLRPLLRRDIVPLRNALADATVAETTRRFFPRSLPSILDWYDHLRESREISSFAIVCDDNFIGFCSLRAPIFSGRELAIAIFDPRYHGLGIGTFAVSKVCQFGFGHLRLPRIELGVYPTNHRGLACYTRCGFRHEALLRRFLYHEGAWRDVVLMSLLRGEWNKQQPSRFMAGEDRNRTYQSPIGDQLVLKTS